MQGSAGSTAAPAAKQRNLRRGSGIGFDQFGLMPENLTTLPHFSVSAARNLPNSAGVIGIGSPPRSLILALSCGSASPAVMVALSLSMISAGVPAGAQVPSQAVASKPGSSSAMAGTSGMTSARVAPVTAKARTRPAPT